MYPSLPNPPHDPRWATSSRAASLTTVVLNVGLVLALLLTQTAPLPPSLPEPLALEFRLPAVREQPPPTPEDRPAEIPEPVRAEPPPAAEPEPVAVQQQAAPVRKTPTRVRTKPIPPAQSRPEPAAEPVEPVTPPPNPAAITSRDAAPPRTAETAAPTDMARIVAALVALIERHQDYPNAARRAGYEGVVVMAVSMDKHGVITGWSLNRASAHPVLDRAAEKTFARLVGRKIEGTDLRDGLRVVVPVKYELRGRS